MKHASLKTLVAAFAAALPLLASAQFSGNVALTTNYKFRGQDQDTHKSKAVKPAIQGGFDYAFGESGWYVGNWNSSVNWLPGNSIEMDFYGGYKTKLGEFDVDLGGLLYAYPGNANGNTTELSAAATYGPVTAKYAHTVSEDYFAFAGSRTGSGLNGRNTGYFSLAFAQEVAPSTTLKASVGFTRFSSDIHDSGVPNYLDYSLGGAYDFGSGVSLAAAIVGANKQSFYGDGNKPRLLLTLSKAL